LAFKNANMENIVHKTILKYAVSGGYIVKQ